MNLIPVICIKTFMPIDMVMLAMIHYEKISHVKHDDGKKMLLCSYREPMDGANRWQAMNLERS
jgi:hypothetical protein